MGAGNIDPLANKGSKNPLSKPDIKTNETNIQSNIGNKTNANTENKGIYKAPALSQQEQNIDRNKTDAQSFAKHSESGLSKDYDILSHNPVLAAQLENRNKAKAPPPKTKQKPPNPNLNVQLAPKGRAINPRKVRPSIPGRLQGFYDNKLDNLSKLSEALGEDNGSINLINQYAKKLLSSHGIESMTSFESLAVLVGLDESIAEFDKDGLITLLEAKIEEFTDERQLQDILREVINQVHNIDPNQENYLRPLLFLFLPIPFQFELEDVDEEFDQDEEETRRNPKKNKKKSEEDKEENTEEEFDSETSLSIKTLNFNKIHFLVRYSKERNQLRVHINGDPSSTELAIPIESNLEEAVIDDVYDINYLIKIWHDNVLRVTERRIVKVKSTGKLSAVMLKACNSILKTIEESDIDFEEDATIDAGYKLL